MPAGPVDSSTDPSGVPTSAPQPQAGNRDQRLPSRSSPGLALRDVGMIFSTIEQLTLKLNRLKVRDTGRGPWRPLVCHPRSFPKNEVSSWEP